LIEAELKPEIGLFLKTFANGETNLRVGAPAARVKTLSIIIKNANMIAPRTKTRVICITIFLCIFFILAPKWNEAALAANHWAAQNKI
jgi:hypothetical protein